MVHLMTATITVHAMDSSSRLIRARFVYSTFSAEDIIKISSRNLSVDLPFSPSLVYDQYLRMRID
jgi:hypothetical protein